MFYKISIIINELAERDFVGTMMCLFYWYAIGITL